MSNEVEDVETVDIIVEDEQVILEEKPKRGVPEAAFESEYKLADFGDRLLAFIIDTVILSVIAGAIGVGGASLVKGSGLGLIVAGAYVWFFWTRNNGQTPGKSIMNIRIVKKNGEKMSDMDVLVRFAGYYVSGAIAMLGFLLYFLNDDRQALHDMFAGTLVIHTKKKKRK